MIENMVFAGMNNKILDGIVKFVPVNMMDNFIIPQRSTQMGFQDKSMFQHSLTINGNLPVTLAGNPTFTVCRLFPEMRISITQKSKHMFVAESIGTNFAFTTGDFAVHDLSSLFDSIPQTTNKRNENDNGVNSGKPKSSRGYGNPEPSLEYTQGRCRDYRRGLAPLMTGKSSPPERDDIVRALWKHKEFSYTTDQNGVSVTIPRARATSAGAAVAGVVAETIAHNAYGMVQVYGYCASARFRNMSGGAPAGAAGVPLCINAAGSVFCLENFDTGSTNIQVHCCGFAIGYTTKWTTAAVAVFLKCL